MLVLTRKLDEKIKIGDNITITVIKLRNNQIRLGIEAPRDVRVLRGELETETKTKVEVETKKELAASQIRNEVIDGLTSADEMIAAGIAGSGNDYPDEGQFCDRVGDRSDLPSGSHGRVADFSTDVSETRVIAGKIGTDGTFRVNQRSNSSSSTKSPRAPLADFFTAP